MFTDVESLLWTDLRAGLFDRAEQFRALHRAPMGDSLAKKGNRHARWPQRKQRDLPCIRGTP